MPCCSCWHSREHIRSLRPTATRASCGPTGLTPVGGSTDIFLATHSPVLISQFEHEDIVVAERGPDQFTTLRRVSQMAELKDLLNEYALGSLYMAEEVGRQSAAETSP